MSIQLHSHELKLTYHARDGRVSLVGFNPSDLIWLADACESAKTRIAVEANEVEFFDELGTALNALTDRINNLDRGNATVTTELPWMDR